MEIRFSKYNLPFGEEPEPGVHYIPLDYQLDMRAGRFNAHVHAYRTATRSHIIEVFDPLSGSRVIHDLAKQSYFAPFASSPDYSLTDDELEFLRELQFDHGIKSAGVRTAMHFKESE